MLSGAAAHLATALDVLSVNGCHWFTADLAEMLAVIDGHITTLEELTEGGAPSGLGV